MHEAVNLVLIIVQTHSNCAFNEYISYFSNNQALFDDMDAETGSPEIGSTEFPVPDNEVVAETPIPGPGDNCNNFSLNLKKYKYVLYLTLRQQDCQESEAISLN